jgi:hypothetical protein
VTSTFFQRIAEEWQERAPELAEWAMAHLVNRVDVWGRYLPAKYRKVGETGLANNAITAPFRNERGKVFLNVASLEKHFKTRNVGGVLGLHSTSADFTSRWLAIDIDLHDPEELSVTREGNFVAAKGWRDALAEMGLDPLFIDSNGNGGFHIWVLFAHPMSTESVHEFGVRLTADYQQRGLDAAPEIFPGKPRWEHYGDWLRVPGRHHSQEYYSRVWNDEPWSESRWLDGHEAIDRILRTQPASIELAEKNGIRQARRTICLDFDGVIHSYRSGWCGAEVIPDPPLHGTREAIAQLRIHFRVVVHSARCRSPEGCQAIEHWLRRHDIEVDEICAYKPPAAIYVDDRAVPFRGDWSQTIADIRQFRK